MAPQSEGSGRSDAKTGRVLRITGIVLVCSAVAWMLMWRFLELDGPFLILNWHVPAMLLGLFLMYRGKQYIARSRPAESLDDTRAPVVYLRPFKEDATVLGRVLPGLANPALLLATFTTFEEQLAEAVQPIGPMLALAQPQAALPSPGAARFHAANEEWQDLVTELLGKARLVVIRPGRSDALRWEIEQAFRMLQPDQLLLLFHRMRRKDYEACAQALEEWLQITLPPFSRRDAFIAFDDDWQPSRLPLRAPYLRGSQYKPWRRLIHHALGPVFRRLGIDWQPAPISALTVSALGLGALLVLFIAILTVTT